MTKELKYILPHSTQFKAKWEEWCKYRSELKKPYKTQSGITMALSKLGKMSEIDAISMIDNSMSNEYQGLYGDGKKNEKGETDTHYTEPKETTVSKYKAKEFDRAEGIAHMRDKLKRNYEKGSYIQDWGGVYTSLLMRHCKMHVPTDIDISLKEKEEEEEKGRKRNRFEEPYSGNLSSNWRDARLNWWLDKQREQGRDISLEI